MNYVILLVLCFFNVFSVYAEDTELLFYRPFGDSVVQSLQGKAVLDGQCNEQSSHIVRNDAWRCRAKGEVLDPCFAPVGIKSNQLLCPKSPWVDATVTVRVSQSLVNENAQPLDMSRSYPWAIELLDGKRCVATEPGKTYDSMPVRYFCDEDHFLFGPIQRCRMPWTVIEKIKQGSRVAVIKKAWF